MAHVVSLDTDNALTSLQTAKVYLGIDLAKTANDIKITQFINSASWFCNSYTQRKLLSRTLTEYYSGDGTSELFTLNYPISSITTVHDDLDRSYGSDTLITATDLVIMPNDLAYKIVYDGGVFNVGIRNIKAVYVAGYATIPYDLEEACLQIIGLFWNNVDKGWLGIIQQSLADGSINIESTYIPKSAMQILDHYKKKW